jgi:hypothetical protein
MQFPSVARIALILAAFSLSVSAVAVEPVPAICDCVVCETVNGVEVCKSCCP